MIKGLWSLLSLTPVPLALNLVTQAALCWYAAVASSKVASLGGWALHCGLRLSVRLQAVDDAALSSTVLADFRQTSRYLSGPRILRFREAVARLPEKCSAPAGAEIRLGARSSILGWPFSSVAKPRPPQSLNS
ncbi:hypothetical protein NDU88_007421 [Pleurodeles waltl]|uniref:Secreted protein n=1 Tax=Pleurodeles waltl TaxID=8319 RepID=A0AAV7RUS3_PLEWA|nr:hypothetical protein NDU88_007421 [Pleurodeles waltl]